jgi:protein tyrosine phosphatase
VDIRSVAGFYSRKGFIVSQHPLDSTVSALWQLVSEQEVLVMVVLSNIDNEDYR